MKYLVLVVLVLGLAACGNNSENGANDNNAHSDMHKHNHDRTVESGDIDPFCGMTKDENWTLYSVHASDTIWFCSEYCKKAVDANPHKYLGEHAH